MAPNQQGLNSQRVTNEPETETEDNENNIQNVRDKLLGIFEEKFTQFCLNQKDKRLTGAEIVFFEALIPELISDHEMFESCITRLALAQGLKPDQASFIKAQASLNKIPVVKDYVKKIDNSESFNDAELITLRQIFDKTINQYKDAHEVKTLREKLLNQEALSKQEADFVVEFFKSKLICPISCAALIDPCRSSSHPNLLDRSSLKKLALDPITRLPITNIEIDFSAKKYIDNFFEKYAQTQSNQSAASLLNASKPNETLPLLAQRLAKETAASYEVRIDVQRPHHE